MWILFGVLFPVVSVIFFSCFFFFVLFFFTCFLRALFTYYFPASAGIFRRFFLQLLQHFFLGLQAGAELRHSLQTAVISEFDPQICGELSKIHTGYGVSAVE